MDLTERMVESKTIFEGKIVRVTLDQAELPNGSLAAREVVYHPGGVAVLALDEDNNVTLVRQFRYPAGHMMLEAPAGKLEYGEDHRECAVRELSEETGFTADELLYLGGFYTSPGFSSELLHIYLALGLHAGESHLDEGEFLNVEKLPLQELVDMVMANQVEDAKTIIAVLKAEKVLRERAKE